MGEMRFGERDGDDGLVGSADGARVEEDLVAIYAAT